MNLGYLVCLKYPYSLCCYCNSFKKKVHLPASVAQLDAHPTGDQKVAGSAPTGSATFFHGDWREIFSTVILSLSLIQED